MENLNGVFIDCCIVNEREKAVEIQQWHGSGSDPQTSARTMWIPRSCILENDGRGIVVKKWFIASNNLWRWVD